MRIFLIQTNFVLLILLFFEINMLFENYHPEQLEKKIYIKHGTQTNYSFFGVHVRLFIKKILKEKETMLQMPMRQPVIHYLHSLSRCKYPELLFSLSNYSSQPI